MSVSAAFTVNGNANPAAHSVAFGSTVTLALTSTTGASSIVWEIDGCSTPGDSLPAITLSGSPQGATASFAMPADPADNLGRSFLIRCTVSNQIRGADGSYQSSVEYGVVGAQGASGYIPIAPGEENYRNLTHGWGPELNALLAGVGGAGGSGDVIGPVSSVDDRLVLFNSTTGKLIKQSTFGIADVIKRDGSTAFTANQSAGGFKLTNLATPTATTDAATKAYVDSRFGGGLGFRFTYSTTTTDADPGAGTFRGNNATLSSVTTLYVDLAEFGGTDVTAWLDSFDDYTGAIKGIARFQSATDQTKWIEYTVTGWTTASGYRKLTVAYKDGPGGLTTTAGDTFFSFDFASTGVSAGDSSVTVSAAGAISRGALTGDVTAPAGSNATTLSNSVVMNAHVNAAAAIAGTKISPNFGAQDIVTTGSLSLDASPATVGSLRGGSAFRAVVRASSVDKDWFTYSADTLSFNDETNNGANRAQSVIFNVANAGNFTVASQGSSRLQLRGSGGVTWRFGTPTLEFDSTVASATLNIATASSGTGSAFVISGQDASAITGVAGGAMTLRAGDATGASGTRTGGALLLRSGSGASNNGDIELQYGTTSVFKSTAGTTYLQGTSGSELRVNGTIRLQVTGTVASLVVPDFRFDATVTTPVIRQNTDASATVTGQLLTLNAQDCSGTTVVTAGALTVRAGDATGGSGTRTGGALTLRSGTGATAAGNVTIQRGATIVAQWLNTTDDFVSFGAAPALGTSGGNIRVSHGITVVQGRNSGGTADRSILTWGQVSSNGINLGNSSGETFITGTQVSVASNALVFPATQVAPVIQQLVDATATITGQLLTISAQDCSGTTSVTAGAMTVRGGDATGASGTRLGGNATLRSGTGATRTGNLFLQIGATNVFQAYATGDPGVNGETRINTASSTLRLGAGTSYQLLIATATVTVSTTTLQFENGQTPVFKQQDETSGTTGKLLTTGAQEVTTTNATTIGGARLDKAGDASGTGTGNRTGGSYTIRSGIGSTGSGTLADGDLTLQRGASFQIQLVKPSSGLVIGLVRTSAVTSTQMPASTGDGVIYIGNATTNPSANPVSGCIVYSNATAFVTRNSSGKMALGDANVDMLFNVQSSFTGYTWRVAGTDVMNYVSNTSGGLVFNSTTDNLSIGSSPGNPAVHMAVGGGGSGANIGLVPQSVNPNFNSAAGVIFIGNRVTLPSANPSSGGYLYADSGALKWRGSSGTITTLAVA